MGRPAHSLAEAELTGYADRFTPEQRKARAAAENLDLTPEQREEIVQLDALIAKAMSECRRGHILRGGRKNPAFAHLATLVKTRKMILEGKRRAVKEKPPQDSFNEFIAVPGQDEDKLN